VTLPEIVDYEIRRELIRLGGTLALANLNGYGIQLEYLPITTAAMKLAADLWARARSTGQPTAPDPALDGDVIVAAQALSLNITVLIATGNPSHLSRFAPADLWSNIMP
jgi:predicted nucleic acid-binding protein